MRKILFLAALLLCFFSRAQDFAVKVEVVKNIKISEATRDSYVVPANEIWHIELTDGTKWQNNGGAGWVEETGGGVTDGDKGDITVASENWTIDNGVVTEAKLSTSVNASLDLADSALQSGDNVSELVNDAGYITEGGNLIPVTQAEYDLLTPTEIEENDYAIVDEDDGSGGASQLSDLSDVGSSTPTNRNVLVADGVDWESRPLVEADISDLKQYLPLTGGTMTGNVTAPSFIKSGATSQDVLLGNGTTTSLNGIKTSPGPLGNGTTEIILEGSTSGAYTVGSQTWRWFRSHDLVFFFMNFNNIDGSTPVGRLRVDISGSTFPPPDANGTTVFNVHIDDWPTAEIYSAYAIEETANYITILVNTGAATSSGSYVMDMDFTGTTDIFISGIYRTTN